MRVACNVRSNRHTHITTTFIRLRTANVRCISSGIPTPGTGSKHAASSMTRPMFPAALSFTQLVAAFLPDDARVKPFEQNSPRETQHQEAATAELNKFHSIDDAERLEIAFAKPEATPAGEATNVGGDELRAVVGNELEERLAEDAPTVATSILAVTGVICFWRGVWSLLDHFIGDSVEGDVLCVLAGLAIIFWIRLTGARVGSFWPGS